MSRPLVVVEQLVKHYPSGGLRRRAPLRAVDGVSLTVGAGETLALVGESGCGKSTFARTLLRLEEPTSGTVRFDGVEVFGLAAEPLRRLRRRMQIVFQDATGALDPRMRVGEAVAEGIEIHRLAPPAAISGRVSALLEEVGLDPALAARYPHELSGGQRQRVGIARALAVDPAFVVLDEPVSALDVSVQAQVLALLQELQRRRGLAYLLISHDLAVVRQVAARIAVMYVGKVVETGPTEALLAQPRHPYTQALISAVPDPDPARQATRLVLPGDLPDPRRLPAGCRFHPRCLHPARDTRCQAEAPALEPAGATLAACHHAREPGAPATS